MATLRQYETALTTFTMPITITEREMTDFHRRHFPLVPTPWIVFDGVGEEEEEEECHSGSVGTASGSGSRKEAEAEAVAEAELSRKEPLLMLSFYWRP